MTIVSSTASLTKVINETVKELEVTQASLDAQVASVQASETAAGADKTEAEGYRDTAATHATAAATSLATVQANVTYQGISAILAEKAVTALDVFVYDTSLDSDGGAWRKRCQHTSWYNETLNTATRGARREFPAVAVIVAEYATTKVTIYDGDDPTLPMWMVFNAADSNMLGSIDATSASVKMFNGIMGFGANGPRTSFIAYGLRVVNFVADIGRKHTNVLNHSGQFIYDIARRNLAGYQDANGFVASEQLIINSNVNGVAMTVLPDAPINPATGLPIPTILVGTVGGSSVIYPDGTVISDTTFNWNSNVGMVAIDSETAVATASSSHMFVADLRGGQFTGLAGSGYAPNSVLSQSYGGTSWLGGVKQANATFVDNTYNQGHLTGIVTYTGITQGANTDWNKVMVRYRDTEFATGWHLYDTRASLLTSTNTNSLVAATPLEDLFDYADTTALLANGWVLGGNAVASEVTVSNSEVTISNADNTDNNFIYKLFDTTAGALYKITLSSTQLNAQARMRIRDGVNANVTFTFGGHLAQTNALTGTYSITFRAVSNQTAVQLGTSNGAGTGTFQDVKIEAVDKDYSVKDSPLVINGTITRSPVATGAELVGYSGFNTSTHYLEQPYNSALDFGTGDFSVIVWLDRMEAWRSVVSRGFTGAVSFIIEGNGSTDTMRISTGNTPRILAMPWFTGAWRQLVFVRRSGVAALYLDGVQTASWSAPEDVSVANAPLFIGRNTIFGSGFYPGNLALLRISATAPTADQIRKIYEDERKLFQPGAQCTLYGTSDTVTALAHDPKTNLLHVGTSQGRSTFDGLVRVANTTTPVGTAISAVNGLIAEE